MGTLLCAVTMGAGARADEAKAREYYAQARAAFEADQFAEAARLFRLAYEEQPSWKLWYNIGQAEAAAKHHGLALLAFESYLAQGGDAVPVERKDEVLAEIKRLRELVASLSITGPEGAEVYVDDMLRGTLPLDGMIKVSVGTRHVVRVVQGGAVLLERPVRLSGGDVLPIDVPAPAAPAAPAESPATEPQPSAEAAPAALPPAPQPEAAPEQAAAAPPPAPTSPPAASTDAPGRSTARILRIIGWSAVGLGVAAAGTGGAFGALALKRTGDLESLCPNNRCTSDEAKKAYDEAWMWGVLSNTFIAAGAGVAATGLILAIIGHRRAESPTATAHIVPVLRSGQPGVAITF